MRGKWKQYGEGTMNPNQLKDFVLNRQGVSLVDYLCYRHGKLSLQEMRLYIGEAKFVDFLNCFAGSYLMLPSSKKLKMDYYDYLSACTLLRIKAAKKEKNLKVWNQQESVLYKIAKKTKRKYKNVYQRAVKIVKGFQAIQLWKKKMDLWKDKYLGGMP
jgi:hypothetical protein